MTAKALHLTTALGQTWAAPAVASRTIIALPPAVPGYAPSVQYRCSGGMVTVSLVSFRQWILRVKAVVSA